ncbi:hypothetical protein SBA5_720030 [Candidatus Sulfotelmatomonas gaucii]|uniref:Transposase IS110-like N-terminal domain-containing protein n=1 Tax=Candidatus Sulfuritelmatomonas gaucii TaxID=2043161 RepID=A0A2N9M308_9BACT|nr:hypothetical protein SBA5_720030 [Candidatus Sulfotelmatomonas gaucii]
MYYIGLDVHKKTISCCVKDVAGHVHREGKIGSTRRELDTWIRTLPQPRIMAMEAMIFTGWIYDYLLPHAGKVKVAHPLMLRAIAAAKKKNDRIDAGKIADCLRCDFLPECHIASTEIRDRRRVLRYRNLVVKQMAHNGPGFPTRKCLPPRSESPKPIDSARRKADSASGNHNLLARSTRLSSVQPSSIAQQVESLAGLLQVLVV